MLTLIIIINIEVYMKRLRSFPALPHLTLFVSLSFACSSPETAPASVGRGNASPSSGGGPSGSGGGTAGGGQQQMDAGQSEAGGIVEDAGAPRCNAMPVACTDESIQQLKLFDLTDAGLPQVNDAGVTEEGTIGGEFVTNVDARGGGLVANTSYLYAAFTSAGLKKRAISDVQALASSDWDIAIRRYVLRINSGVSGPSCTESATLPANTKFEDVTQVPEGLTWQREAYFSPTCEYVAGDSGIGAPATALSSFWTYSACLQMTYNVFVLHLKNGRYVKLQVLSYYNPQAQAECDDAGVARTPSGAGNVRIRWAFIAPPR